MSAFRQQLLVRSAPRFVQRGAVRSFSIASRLNVSKETDLHHEGRAEEIEKEHAKKHSGQWVEGLASDSESIAKADRGELKGGDQTIEQLQKETASLANEKKLDDLEKLKKGK